MGPAFPSCYINHLCNMFFRGFGKYLLIADWCDQSTLIYQITLYPAPETKTNQYLAMTE